MSNKPLTTAFISQYEEFCTENGFPHYTKFGTEIGDNIVDASTDFVHSYVKEHLNTIELKKKFILEYGFAKLIKIILYFEDEDECDEFVENFDETIENWIHAVLLHVAKVYIID